MSQRDKWVRLELTRACVSDQFADVTAAAFTAQRSNPANGLPRGLRPLATYRFLVASRYLPTLHASTPSASRTFPPSNERGGKRTRPQKATSRIYVATERSEGGSPSLPMPGTSPARAREHGRGDRSRRVDMKSPIPAAYRGALDRPCPTCGALVGEYCTRTDDTRVRRIRRVPCVKRCPPSSVPSAQEPLWPSRSFSEPLRGES